MAQNTQTIPMKNQKMGPYGGFIPSGKNTIGENGRGFKTNMVSLSTANPGAAVVAKPIDLVRAVFAPVIDATAATFIIEISGVTGVDEASINGERTATRTGDDTFTIGVDTTLLTFDVTNASVQGIPWTIDATKFPKADAFGYKL